MAKKKADPKGQPLEEAIDDVARSVAQEVLTSNPPLDEKVGALRALSAYWAMKNKLPPPQDDKDKPNAFQKSLEGLGGSPAGAGNGAAGPGKF